MVAERPLLLIDVDGVLSLFGFDATAPPEGLPLNVDGIPHWLSAQAKSHLSRLADDFECVWCTGWEGKADEHLPRALGLTAGWCHLTLGHESDGRHWKLRAMEAFAGPQRRVGA